MDYALAAFAVLIVLAPAVFVLWLERGSFGWDEYSEPVPRPRRLPPPRVWNEGEVLTATTVNAAHRENCDDGGR